MDVQQHSNRIANSGKQDPLQTAWQFAHFAQQNMRNIGDGIGKLIVAELDPRKADAMLQPYFQVRRAQHQIRGCGR